MVLDILKKTLDDRSYLYPRFRKTTQAISYNANSVQPPEKVEKLRRKLFNDVRELRYFINFHIIGRYKNQAKREIKDIYEVIQGYKR